MKSSHVFWGMAVVGFLFAQIVIVMSHRPDDEQAGKLKSKEVPTETRDEVRRIEKRDSEGALYEIKCQYRSGSVVCRQFDGKGRETRVVWLRFDGSRLEYSQQYIQVFDINKKLRLLQRLSGSDGRSAVLAKGVLPETKVMPVNGDDEATRIQKFDSNGTMVELEVRLKNGDVFMYFYNTSEKYIGNVQLFADDGSVVVSLDEYYEVRDKNDNVISHL